MPKVCQDMHKCHNYHAILHKLYTWFGKNERRLYLNRAKKISIRGAAPAAPPSKYAHGIQRLDELQSIRNYYRNCESHHIGVTGTTTFIWHLYRKKAVKDSCLVKELREHHGAVTTKTR